MKIKIVKPTELAAPWWINPDGTLLLNGDALNDIEEAYEKATDKYYSAGETEAGENVLPVCK